LGRIDVACHPVASMNRSSISDARATGIGPSISPAARWRATAIVAAVLGAGASAYLLVEYTTGQSGVCLTGSGCDAVRASDFAYPLGIPLPLFGLAFYLVATWMAVRTLEPARLLGLQPATALLGVSAFGVVFSAVLTGIEAFVIGAFCTWCLVSALASVVLLAAAVGLWRTPAAVDDESSSSRARQQRARAAEAERAGVRRALLGSSSVMALVVAGLLAAGALGSGAAPVGNGDDLLAPATSPHLGNGAVTVVEFADFQCPACSTVGPILADLGLSDAATVVFRYFPLETIHANANASSRAAAAAHLQGAFWAMSERLFATQAQWENLSESDADAFFLGLAGQLGMDAERWRVDYTSSEVRNTVAADASYAMDLNLRGTPSIYIDGELYEGSYSATAIRAAVAAANGGS
jgi:protein-disulfide isomerase